MAQSTAAEVCVAQYFQTHGRAGLAGALTAARHPITFAKLVSSIRRLPVLDADLRCGSRADAAGVRQGLHRSNRLVRCLLLGTTAVLRLPDRVGAFTEGASGSKRSLRTRVHKAERMGLTWERVPQGTARQEILRLTDRYELTHPIADYRGDRPDTRHLLDRELWLLARSASGRPLLLAVSTAHGPWAVLDHFRTIEHSAEASTARYWMSSVLADALVERGVRYLADPLSPVGLPNGLRIFQRQIGYRYVRVRTRG